MRSRPREFLAGLFAAVALLAAASGYPAAAQDPDNAYRNQLIGRWQLVSIAVDNEMPYGANPKGTMFADAAGHFSVIVISTGKANSVSFFGTYTINPDRTVTTHITANTGGAGVNIAGSDLKRILSLNGDELTVRDDTPSGPGAIKVVWKRAD